MGEANLVFLSLPVTDQSIFQLPRFSYSLFPPWVVLSVCVQVELREGKREEGMQPVAILRALKPAISVK